MTKKRHKLLAGEPGYGDTCPDCGGPKNRDNRRCLNCRKTNNGEGVVTTGRFESIITFRNTATGDVRTLHCRGTSVKAQVEHGRQRLAAVLGNGQWDPECRSTPQTILGDLQGSMNPEHRARELAQTLRRAS